ncbi:hypothetical protein JW766_01315 [Candidatus Dojkabacteria bacterium]|nr:hypothetical protein [Candidatus Dojkabacteria bacterium]
MESGSKFLKISAINFIVLSVLFGVFLINSLIFTPSVSKLYEEFGADLPVLTLFFVRSTEYFTQFWFIFLPVVLIFILLISLGIAYLLRNVGKKMLILLYVIPGILLTCGFVAFLSLVVYMPMYNLANTVS